MYSDVEALLADCELLSEDEFSVLTGCPLDKIPYRGWDDGPGFRMLYGVDPQDQAYVFLQWTSSHMNPLTRALHYVGGKFKDARLTHAWTGR